MSFFLSWIFLYLLGINWFFFKVGFFVVVSRIEVDVAVCCGFVYFDEPLWELEFRECCISFGLQ